MNEHTEQTAISNETKSEKMIELTAQIVSAYVSNHVVPASDLGKLIHDTHASLSNAVTPVEVQAQEPAKKLTPAVSIRKSIDPDGNYIICLEDGKQFKSLKRHLGVHYNMTPEEYRAKWGLPDDYPMVAPAYAEKRSALAREMGLGQRRKKAA